MGNFFWRNLECDLLKSWCFLCRFGDTIQSRRLLRLCEHARSDLFLGRLLLWRFGVVSYCGGEFFRHVVGIGETVERGEGSLGISGMGKYL